MSFWPPTIKNDHKSDHGGIFGLVRLTVFTNIENKMKDEF